MTQPIHPMLERVARAMLADDLDRPGVKRDFDSVWEDEASCWIASARAAIQALLEPDEGMIEAGFREITDLCRTNIPYDLRRERLSRAYGAILRPLIGEGE